MKTEINYKSLIPYFICTAVYMFFAIMNVQVINQTLIFEEAAAGDLDRIYNHDIMGYSAAGILLLIISTYFSFRRIVIFSVIVSLFSIYDLGFTEYEESITEIHAFVCSATMLIITTVLFAYVISDKKITTILGISTFFLGVVVADFLVELTSAIVLSGQISITLQQIQTLVILNIIALTVFLVIFIFNKNFTFSTKTKAVNITAVAKNTGVEMIYFFVNFYIIMVIFYNYESYELTDILLRISVSNIKYYMLLGIFILSIFLNRFIKLYNLHKINLLSITVLLFMFLSMPFWGMNNFLGFICWFILGAFMYMTFCLTILILAEKFGGSSLKIAIVLCSFAATAGYYCGYLSAYNVEDEVSETAFLILICLSLMGLLAYYFYIYKKNNLKNW